MVNYYIYGYGKPTKSNAVPLNIVYNKIDHSIYGYGKPTKCNSVPLNIVHNIISDRVYGLYENTIHCTGAYSTDLIALNKNIIYSIVKIKPEILEIWEQNNKDFYDTGVFRKDMPTQYFEIWEQNNGYCYDTEEFLEDTSEQYDNNDNFVTDLCVRVENMLGKKPETFGLFD